MSEETTEETERDYETEAKNLGWHNPEDKDFRGDPDKALDAKDFVEKGENEMPLLRANIKKLQKQAEEDRSSREEYRGFMESQMKQQEADFERRQRDAVKDGNVEEFDLIAKEKAAAVPKTPTVDVNVQAAVSDFQSRNSWYGIDDQMTQYAKFQDSQIGAQNLALTPEQHFKKVEEAVMKQFPKQTTRNTPPQAVEGGRKRPAAPTAAKTYAAMPQEFRTACDKMVKGWGITEDAYVKKHWADQE